MKAELLKVDTMTELEANAIQDVWQLDLNSRWRLYRWQNYFEGLVRQVFPRIIPVCKLCQAMLFLPVSVQLLVWTCLFLLSLYCMSSNVMPYICTWSGLSIHGNVFPKRHGESFELNPLRTCGSPSCFPCSVYNGTFFPGFGWRFTRVLFERTSCSMNSSIRQQQKDWKNRSWSKISAFSIMPVLWGWQLQVQSSWEANQYFIASSHV